METPKLHWHPYRFGIVPCAESRHWHAVNNNGIGFHFPFMACIACLAIETWEAALVYLSTSLRVLWPVIAAI